MQLKFDCLDYVNVGFIYLLFIFLVFIVVLYLQLLFSNTQLFIKY